MEIYVVQADDTIEAIANSYGISVEKLIKDNNLTDPYHLVPGENIIILYPSQTYAVQEGDTLESIAAFHSISVNELLRNNPFLSDIDYIYPGDILTIGFNRNEKIPTHGYTNTFIDRKTLSKTLPYLTYLSIFNYRIVENGNVIGNDDDMDIIQMSIQYGVVPLMHLTTLTVMGDINLELTYNVLLSEAIQNKIIDNVLIILRQKGYYGVTISAQYITEENQSLYINFTKKLSAQLMQEGYLSIISINPKIESYSDQISYPKIDYFDLADLVNSVVFLQYRWGINHTPPAPVISIKNISNFLDYALTQINNQMIITGIPILGYIWKLPFVMGYSQSKSLTVDSAINLARNVGTTIQFDKISQTPYFNFNNSTNNSIQYVVWSVNAETINSLIRMLLDKGINGTGVWNIMYYFTHLWLVINSQYEIIKLIPEF